MKLTDISITFRQFLPKKLSDILLYGAFALAIIILINLYRGINDDDGNWDEFKNLHHCQLKRSGDSNIQSTWECDDGKTYYRWRQLKS